MDDDEDWGGDELVLAYLENTRGGGSRDGQGPAKIGSGSDMLSIPSMSQNKHISRGIKRDRKRSAMTPTSSSESILNCRPIVSSPMLLPEGGLDKEDKKKLKVKAGMDDLALPRKRTRSTEGSDSKASSSSNTSSERVGTASSQSRKSGPALSLLREDNGEASGVTVLSSTSSTTLSGKGPINPSPAASTKSLPRAASCTPRSSTRSLRPRPSQIIDICESPPLPSTTQLLDGRSSFPTPLAASSNKFVPIFQAQSPFVPVTTSNDIELAPDEKSIWPPTKIYVDEAMAEYNKKTKEVLEKRKMGKMKEEKVVKNEDGTDKRTRAEITRHLLSTLKDEANPITHSDIYSRTQHVISAATGHQVSNKAGGTKFGISSGDYFKSRNQKLKQQFRAQVSDGIRAAELANGGGGEDTNAIASGSGSGSGSVETSAIDLDVGPGMPYPMESTTGTQLGPVTDKPGLGGIGIGGRFSVEMAKKRPSSGSSSGSFVETGFMQTSNIFAGLTFYLNGYSGPRISDLELKRLLAVHGGNIRRVCPHPVIFITISYTHFYYSYVASSACTHILVVNNLSASKAQKFLDSSGSTRGKKCKVVHVDWVLDSVEQGKRLGELKYNVINNRTQPTLMASWASEVKAGGSGKKSGSSPPSEGNA